MRGDLDRSPDLGEPMYNQGFWYAMHQSSHGAGAVLPANTLRLVPFRLRQLVNISGLGLRITTLAAGGNVQLGIYAANGNTLLPTGLVRAFSPSFPTDAAGAFTALFAAGPVQFPRGVYWLGVNADAAAGGTVIAQTIVAAAGEFANLVGAAALGSFFSGAGAASFCRTIAATFGTWPELTPPGATAEAATTASATAAFLVQS